MVLKCSSSFSLVWNRPSHPLTDTLWASHLETHDNTNFPITSLPQCERNHCRDTTGCLFLPYYRRADRKSQAYGRSVYFYRRHWSHIRKLNYNRHRSTLRCYLRLVSSKARFRISKPERSTPTYVLLAAVIFIEIER